MTELYINLRSKTSSASIWAPEYILASAPASELLYECKGTGTLLPLYKLLRLRGPRGLGLSGPV